MLWHKPGMKSITAA